MRETTGAIVGLAFLLVVPGWSSSRENRLPAVVEAVLSKPARLEALSLEPAAREGELAAEIVAAVGRGIAESDGSVARCLEPRHGIRASSREAVADLVICCECLQIEAYVNDKQLQGALTSASPQAFLDGVVRDARSARLGPEAMTGFLRATGWRSSIRRVSPAAAS